MAGSGGDGYGILRDRRVPDEGAPRLELPAEISVLRAAEVLEVLFRADGGIHSVAIVVGAEVVGGAGRDHVELAADDRGVGSGDGATLPGYSGEYKLLTYVCGVCESVTYRLQVDPRDQPECVNGHGVMDRKP